MRRFVRLRQVEPDVSEVESVLLSDTPPQDPLVVAAPPGIPDDDLLHMAKSGENWVPKERLSSTSTDRRGPVKKITPGEVLWNAYIYNLSGYAKANRETMFRLQKDLKIQLVTGDYLPEKPTHPESHINNRLLMAEQTEVSEDAPIVRFFLPRRETEQRYRVLWFMSETERMHPRLIARIDSFYDEVWFPTSWNIESFLKSGGQKPAYRMPLGVDPTIYRPGKRGRMPACWQLSPEKVMGHPSGFIFLYVFQPVFRKGAEFLVRAFEKAFATRSDVHLVLATTGYPTEPWVGKIMQACKRSTVWLMKDRLSEARMADLYRAADAYVCTSMGEGWNLPLCEAAACGLPVIAPRHTAHLDYLTQANSYLFDPDGFDVVEGAKGFCTWYDGMPFARFGEKSMAQLVSHLWDVVFRYEASAEKAVKLQQQMTTEYTWDAAAARVLTRLRAISSSTL